METEILQFMQTIGWAGVAGLVVWKILAPLTKHLIKKNGGNNADALDKVEKIKNNDLHEIRADIRDLKIEQVKQGKDIAWLKAKINNKK